MYDAQAGSIKVEDITTNENNRNILRRLMRHRSVDPITSLYIQNQSDDEEEDDDGTYVPEGVHDMGWLGYFIGKNEQLQSLHIRSFEPLYDASFEEVLVPFFKGLHNNKSISMLIFSGMNISGGRVFDMLGKFFNNNDYLEDLSMSDCHLADIGWRMLALAIGNGNSLTELALMNNNISDERLVDIITALSVHCYLVKIDLDKNRLGKNGCLALSTLLKCSVTGLEHLDLANNELDDESVGALVPGLKNCSHLHTLRLSRNEFVTSKGWQQLASILEAPNSNIYELVLATNNVDNEAAAEFARFLVNNSRLHSLNLNSNQVNAKGWEAFSNILCDTSSINSTFNSNHFLNYLATPTNVIDLDGTVQSLLDLNNRGNKKLVAMVKILYSIIMIST